MLPSMLHCLNPSGSLTSNKNIEVSFFSFPTSKDLLSSYGEIFLSADSLNSHFHAFTPPSKYLAFKPIPCIISAICIGYSLVSDTRTISISLGNLGMMSLFDSSLHTAQAEPGICCLSYLSILPMSKTIGGSLLSSFDFSSSAVIKG
jgi:hypothetical protein